MGKRAAFTQAELSRAIRAAKAAGMEVTRCAITPDGRIVLSDGQHATQAAEDPFETWKAKREGRAERRS
jgi:hypothetical protein